MTAGSPSRLRVLVVAAGEPWPLNSGARLHLYHVLREISARAQVTLALPQAPQHRDCLPERLSVETIATPRDAGFGGCRGDALRRHAARVGFHAYSEGSHATGLVARLARRHFGMREPVAAWLHRHARADRFDVVMLNGAVFGQFAPYCHVPVVWNPQDELVLHTMRGVPPGRWRDWAAAARHALLYAAYERCVARQAAATIFVSTVDAGYARRWVGRARLEVVQNGVDFEYFRPTPAPPVPGTVAFVGSLEFPPNVDGIVQFAWHVWPGIYTRGTRRRLLVVGRRPVAAVRALRQLPGVELVSDVPDVRPYLAQASVVVVPTRQGGGLKNKILEGCAMRRPVVASLRALGGLSVRVGTDLLAAEQPQNWVVQVGRLLDQPAYAENIARSGYAWVRRTHHWSTTGDRFLEILASARRARVAEGARPVMGGPGRPITGAALSVAPGGRHGEPRSCRRRRVYVQEAACR
jgi:glycosyltransferase involved in cell wall biosynthesis